MRKLILKKLLIWAGQILTIVWLLLSLYLLATTDYPDRYGVGTKIFVAARDAFYSLPDVVAYLVSGILELIELGHDDVIEDLGHDPILPDFGGGDHAGAVEYFSTREGAIPWGLPQYWSVLVSEVLLCVALAGAGVTASQTVILFGIMATGGEVSWRALGLPVVENVRLKLVYSILNLVVAVGFAYGAFQVGAAAGVATVVIALVCIRLPLLAGLLLWLLTRFLGLHPRFIVVSIAAAVARAGDQFSPVGGAASGTPHSDVAGNQAGETAKRRSAGPTTEKAHEQTYSENCAEQGSMPSHEEDCVLFELEPGMFDQSTLIRRYREKMDILQANTGGIEEAADSLNAAYERILEHYGWQR